jgi:uncharacterized membrane protein SpoIIM required for sporulation/uncharacterized RDD family membrane protein YckC
MATASPPARPAAAPPAPPHPLDQLVEVETPEQVVFSYSVAGIGSRAAAAAIDFLIILASVAALWLALLLLVPTGIAAGAVGVGAGSWGMAAAILLTFGIAWGYYVLWEGLRDGQTPGKRRLGLRVVQDGGYSVSLAASAVRNLLRIVDIQPFPFYGVGIVSAVLSRGGKRLGDIAAGTIVVHERVVPAAVSSGSGDAGAAPAVAQLSDEEYGLLDRWVARRAELAPERRQEFAARLWERFRDRFPDERDSAASPALLRIHERERSARARGAAARGARGAARERHVIVAQGAERWSDFARTLAGAQRRGLRAMSEAEVEAFVARYREVATDLARLQTASRGRDQDAVFYVSRLVAAGHNLLYRQRRSAAASAWRYLTATVPREIRRSWRLVALAAILLFTPAGTTYVAVLRRPALAYELMPPGMIDRAESARAREARGEGYLPSDEIGPLPVLASGIAANNIHVTYTAFAGGILFGLGTVLILVSNGILIGGAVGLFATKEVAHLILAFMAPHGVLELSAICIAAAGGLHLATAILLPGALTRRAALVVRGRRAIRLIAAATLLLLVAGAIEGFISPRVWPLGWKLAVSGATAVLLALFVSLGRDGVDEPREQTAYATE